MLFISKNHFFCFVLSKSHFLNMFFFNVYNITSLFEFLSLIIFNFKLIFVFEKFYIWDVDVKLFLKRKSAFWTIEKFDKFLFIV